MASRFPCVIVLAFVLIGIVVADLFSLAPYPLLIAGMVVFMAALYAVGRRPIITAVLLGIAFCLFSGFHFSLRYIHPGPNDLRSQINEPTLARVFGQVTDWPDLKQRWTGIIIDVDSLEVSHPQGIHTHFIEGALLLKISDTVTALQRGDHVSFRARIYPIQATERKGFDYGRYLNLKGIQAIAYLPTVLSVEVDRRSSFGFVALVDNLRATIHDCLNRNLGERAAALANGFLIGETRDIPPDIYKMFRDSGTLHLLAVSGSNVALVIFFIVWLLRPFWFGPLTRAIILLAVVAIFAGLSYGDPSVIRASVMAALVIGAMLLGRTFDLNNIIAATALIILVVEPSQLFDVGFQLSFVTAWGLVFIIPKLAAPFKRFHDRQWYRWLIFPLLVTLVAQVCSAPIIAYYFGRLPVVGLAANLIIVPMVSIGVIGVLLLLAADMVLPILGSFAGSLVDLWLNTVVSVLEFFGGETMPVISTSILPKSTSGALIVVCLYLLLVLLVFSLTRKSARRLTVATIIVSANVILGAVVAASFDHRLTTLEFRSVPGGVAIIVQDQNRDNPDLILTGLSQRDYDLDKTILSPLLEELGIHQLGRVFLLSGDYDTLDDLLRMAVQSNAAGLYVDRHLYRSVTDVQINSADTLPTLDVIAISDRKIGFDQAGLYPSTGEVCVNLGHSLLVVTRELRTRHFEPVDFNGSVTLVIGTKWTPAPDDWIRLRQAGYERIICTTFEQSGDQAWPDSELNPDKTPPIYISDLSRFGSLRLDLPL